MSTVEAIEFLNENSGAIQAVATVLLGFLTAFYVVFTLRLAHAGYRAHLRPRHTPGPGTSAINIDSWSGRAVDVVVKAYVLPPGEKGRWEKAEGERVLDRHGHYHWTNYVNRKSPICVTYRTVTGLREATYWRWPKEGEDGSKFVELSRRGFWVQRAAAFYKLRLTYRVPEDARIKE